MTNLRAFAFMLALAGMLTLGINTQAWAAGPPPPTSTCTEWTATPTKTSANWWQTVTPPPPPTFTLTPTPEGPTPTHTNTVYCLTVLPTVAVCSVNFIAPNEDRVVIKGQQVEFVAKLGSPPPSGVTVSWLFTFVEGFGDPPTGEGESVGSEGDERKFVTTIASKGTVRLKVQVYMEDQMCGSATRTVESVVPEVVEVSFKNDITLHNFSCPGGAGDEIEDPVWKKDYGASSPSKDEPAAYVRTIGSTPSNATLMLGIQAPKNPHGSQAILMRGVSAIGFSYMIGFIGSWADIQTVGPFYFGALHASNNFYDMEVTWEYTVRRLDGTYPWWEDGIGMGTTEHRVYTTFDTPLVSPVFDFALEKVCKEYAAGAQSMAAVASGVNAGIAADICYHPDAQQASGLGVFCLNEPKAKCDILSNLMVELVRFVGVEGETRFFFGGEPNQIQEYFFMFNDAFGRASMRSDMEGHDEAYDFEFFRFHAQCKVSGMYYDPSYNSEGKAVSTHGCAPFIEQSGSPSSVQMCDPLPPVYRIDANIPVPPGCP